MFRMALSKLTSRKLIIIGTAVIIVFLAAVWATGNVLSSPVNGGIGGSPTDLNAVPVQFSSLSGATIHGWLIRGKENAGVIILMHGVRANRLSMLERARFLAHADYSVLLFDFQAHGESLGKQITFGYLESKDAQSAVNYIRSILPTEKIGIIGVSMGGAAVLLAKPQSDVKAVVIEMVYPTIEQAISNRLTEHLGSWATVLTPLLTWQLKPRLGISADELRPIAHVGELNMPKLFIAGANDHQTTLKESNQLYEAASMPKEFWIAPNAKHEDLHTLAKEEYEKRVLNFFEMFLRLEKPNLT